MSNFAGMKQYLRKYPLTILLTIAIWTVCLIPMPETPLDDVPMMDKWTHFVMFGTLCCLIFIEYGVRHNNVDKIKLAVFGVVIPFLMGGAIELAQAFLTCGNRNGDLKDWLADGVGVVIGAVIGILPVYLLSRRKKDI